MPALAPYLPALQADYDAWLTNFSTRITAAPGTFGLTAGEAATIAAAEAAWHAAYLLATTPGTKTPVTVAAKDAERVLSMAVVRLYAVQISLNPGVLAADKVDVGVNPRTSVPAPIAAPATAPQVGVQSSIPLELYMNYRDPLAAPSVKSKPYGVTRFQLFGKLSAVAIIDPLLLEWQKDATKSPFTLSFGAGASGQKFYYAGRWVVRTGLASPFSAIGNYVIP
jgi:hypothetical protein